MALNLSNENYFLYQVLTLPNALRRSELIKWKNNLFVMIVMIFMSIVCTVFYVKDKPV